MRHTLTALCTLIALFAILCLAGCGSGGGESSSGSRSVNVYVTDSFRDDYSHVLVTLYKIEATSDGQSYQTLYEDAGGQTIDLTSLADAAQLLASVDVPNAELKQVRVVFGDHITLTPKAGGTSLSVPVEDHPPLIVTSGGKSTVTLEAHPGAASARLSNLVVDFDLSAFALVGGRLRPSLKPGDPSEFHKKHHDARLVGTVANLSAGAGFDLQLPFGNHTIAVKVTDATSISRADTGANATLANGQHVMVEGTVDPSTDTLTAESIRILNNEPPGQIRGAIGTVASINATGHSFELTIRHSLHLEPTGDTIHVQTDSDTAFHAFHHEDAGFSQVQTGAVVGVMGDFDAATQTLKAKRVDILPGNDK